MKYTFRKAGFKSRCNDCQREEMEVFFSDTDVNSDSAICLDCLENMQSNCDDEIEIVK